MRPTYSIGVANPRFDGGMNNLPYFEGRQPSELPGDLDIRLALDAASNGADEFIYQAWGSPLDCAPVVALAAMPPSRAIQRTVLVTLVIIGALVGLMLGFGLPGALIGGLIGGIVAAF